MARRDSATRVLPEEINALRDPVREAVAGVTAKFSREDWLAATRDGRFPTEAWDLMARQGLLGLGVPEEFGGSGGGLTEEVAAMEAMAEAGVPLVLFLLTVFARTPILLHGTPEQRQRFVAPTADGGSSLCFAITEPDAGTNSFAISTTAVPDGSGGYLLNGQKIFISGVDAADRMMVVARSTRLADAPDRRHGFSLLVLDVNSPGVSFTPLDMGLVMPDRQFTVHFDNVQVPAENIIGAPDDGFRYLFDALNPERMLAAAWALGLGDYALNKAVRYARDRSPFGKPIGAYQAIQHPLAQARTRLDAARLMMYTATRQFDAGMDAAYAANAAKLLASQAAVEACDAAIQTHGGYAFTDEYDVSAIWGVTRLIKVVPVNNEVVLNHIGEHVLGLPRS
ncbi:acyl-CoA dehydrogenase family protein [Yinghuangia sp. YIM S09857]|uniref:acyl-CoA dehydrogenase family protein n=1 Tax=Yinghuangia sp. YIM S09857 TaxID=3436929 RepID=UPI003F52A18F